MAPSRLQNMPDYLSRTPIAVLHSASTIPEETQRPSELGVAHAEPVRFKIDNAFSRLLTPGSVDPESGKDCVDLSVVEFCMPVFDPGEGFFAVRTEPKFQNIKTQKKATDVAFCRFLDVQVLTTGSGRAPAGKT
ncbi:MAG: hypothetical protein ACYCTV_11595, partial [Leptospirales bacterium]